VSCEFCTDPDGFACFPQYGVAPHVCFYKIPGASVGQSQLLPESEWPENFMPDPEAPGLGTYWCPHCGDGKPEIEKVSP
jgi:hypothetical protein